MLSVPFNRLTVKATLSTGEDRYSADTAEHGGKMILDILQHVKASVLERYLFS